MNLDVSEMKVIDELRYNSAYKLILDAVQAEIDNCEVAMESGDTNVFHFWRALRRVLFILSNYPERIHDELVKEKERLGEMAFDEIAMKMPSSQQLKVLKEYYDRKKKI